MVQEQFEINGTYEVKRFNSNREYIGTCKGFAFTTSKGMIATDVSLNHTIRSILKEYNRKESKIAEDKGMELNHKKFRTSGRWGKEFLLKKVPNYYIIKEE